MSIYAFIQMYNESSTGNLLRCLENCKKWADDIIIYDDSSTDDSVNIAEKYTKNIILGKKNEWTRETFHKQEILEYIHNMEKKPKWLLWIDCDEIIDNSGVRNLQKFCDENINENIDAYSFQQINLWRGELYYRTDGLLYGENYNGCGWFVRLWKYNEKLHMKKKIGADQRLYPITINTIKQCSFKIIHYGFSNYKNLMKHIGVHNSTKEQLIKTASGEVYLDLANADVEWAKTYVINGKGIPNMFLNEENLSVNMCDDSMIDVNGSNGVKLCDIFTKPEPILNENIDIYCNIKENILFMGNCQMKVIKDYCMYYLKKKINYLNCVLNLETQNCRADYLIKNADIIVMQPLYSGIRYYNDNKIKEIAKKDIYIVYTHCLYYDGCFPHNKISDYCNLDKNDKLKNKILENSNKSFQNLTERENGLNNYIKIDIPIVEFIKENIKNKRLFLRENHPCNFLMNKCAFMIYKNIINNNKYFSQTNETKYNNIFDTSEEILNKSNTYLTIDDFTYNCLEYKW
jgi:hypothetical protein